MDTNTSLNPRAERVHLEVMCGSPPHEPVETIGFFPIEGFPLAVTRNCQRVDGVRGGRMVKGWTLTHMPTGFHLFHGREARRQKPCVDLCGELWLKFGVDFFLDPDLRKNPRWQELKQFVRNWHKSDQSEPLR